jgi:hypothetical protein
MVVWIKNDKDKSKIEELTLFDFIKKNSSLFVVMGVFGAITVYLKTLLSTTTTGLTLTNLTLTSNDTTFIINNMSYMINANAGTAQPNDYSFLLDVAVRSSLLILIIIGAYIVKDAVDSRPRSIDINFVLYVLFFISIITLICIIASYVVISNFPMIFGYSLLIAITLYFSDMVKRLGTNETAGRITIIRLIKAANVIVFVVIAISALLLYSNVIKLIEIIDINQISLSVVTVLMQLLSIIVGSLVLITVRDRIRDKLVSVLKLKRLVEIDNNDKKTDRYDVFIVIFVSVITILYFYFIF